MEIPKSIEKVWHQGLFYELKENGISGNLLQNLSEFLKDQKQKVVLNEQNYSWGNVETLVSQGSMLYLLLPLIYINDLPDNLTTNAKLFADTSLFSVDRDITISSCDLNDDLKTAKQRAFQRKMRFNLLQWKQAQEIVFSGKFKKQITLRYIFKRVPWRNLARKNTSIANYL